MDVIRDVLDNQLVDSNQRKIGKVDGIVVELREEKPPRLAYIEVGKAKTRPTHTSPIGALGGCAGTPVGC